jgi:oligoribonuclease
MTGLNPLLDHILEIACVITNNELDIITELNIVIHQSNTILSQMNEWCKEQHAKVSKSFVTHIILLYLLTLQN